VVVMLVVVFAGRLAQGGVTWLAPVGRLAWPWYVPLGTLLAVGTGIALSYFHELPPNERRIIHMVLAETTDIATESTGEGDQRRVVVSLKRPARA